MSASESAQRSPARQLFARDQLATLLHCHFHPGHECADLFGSSQQVAALLEIRDALSAYDPERFGELYLVLMLVSGEPKADEHVGVTRGGHSRRLYGSPRSEMTNGGGVEAGVHAPLLGSPIGRDFQRFRKNTVTIVDELWKVRVAQNGQAKWMSEG